jgi:hypothetical protein
MISIYLIGDGPRDQSTVPPLLETITGDSVQVRFTTWKELPLQHGSGYLRRLMLALAQARDFGDDAVVAVIDQDMQPQSQGLRAMREARSKDRQFFAPLPTAVGEAIPHGEAWLLDDPHGVRFALQLASSEPIPSLSRCEYPKTEIDRLIDLSPFSDQDRLENLARIARETNPRRCQHAKVTGLHQFVEEVNGELKQFFSRR